MTYKNLFKEGQIGNLKIKNRIVFPAMGIALATEIGEATEEMINYYEERAKGGCGLIIAGMTNVDTEVKKNMPSHLAATDSVHSHNLQKLARRVQKYGSKIFLQLDHPGRETSLLKSYSSEIVGPSAVPCTYSKDIVPRVLTIKEIKRLVGKYVISSLIAKKSGFDGVEINGAHGFLVSQFLSPHTNLREDKYGGSFTNRLNFLMEIVLGIKEICGSDFPILVRLNGDDFINGGLGLEDSVEISKILESLGVDGLNISSGTFESANTMVEPGSKEEGWKKYLAKKIKENVSIPVISSNFIKSPKLANDLIREGVSDFIVVGRGLLADSHWPKKAFMGEDHKIRKCISCLDCMTAITSGNLVQCGVNPRLALEKVYPYGEFPKTKIKRPVVVIGGGPSGMEAAITLLKRGFQVILFERKSHLGGNCYLSSLYPGNKSIKYLTDIQINELKSLKADIRLNTSPSTKDLKEINPYAIYIATGAHLVKPNLQGIDHKKSIFTRDILENNKKFYNKNIIVIGSDIRQISIADYISENDNNVMVFEESNTICNGMYFQLVDDVMDRLRNKRVKVITNYKFICLNDRGVKFLNKRNHKEEIFDADYVVFLREDYNILDLPFTKEIKKQFDNVFVIGDASTPINLTHAVRTGFINSYNL